MIENKKDFTFETVLSTDRNVRLLQKAKYRYGIAKYMRDSLPNAAFIGFTGTPIDFDDKSTV